MTKRAVGERTWKDEQAKTVPGQGQGCGKRAAVTVLLLLIALALAGCNIGGESAKSVICPMLGFVLLVILAVGR